VERLCARLPELVPEQPACLNHGDLWSGNVLGAPDGGVAVVDPAVSYTWAESELSMLWCSPRPPGSERFFTAYAEVSPLAAGWRERMPVLHLREVLSALAHGVDDWDAAGYVRGVVAPFRARRPGGAGSPAAAGQPANGA
jgi:fructosamine-3-kinase